jgi:hypothetical protein
MFDEWIDQTLSSQPKIPCALPTISVQLSSTSTKTSLPARTATSSKDRQTGVQSIGLSIPEKLCNPNKEMEKKAAVHLDNIKPFHALFTKYNDWAFICDAFANFLLK